MEIVDQLPYKPIKQKTFYVKRFSKDNYRSKSVAKIPETENESNFFKMLHKRPSVQVSSNSPRRYMVGDQKSMS